MSFKLKELLDEKGYIRGPFGSALRRNELLDEGIPVYEQQNAIYNNREFRYFINNEKYEEMKRFTVRENDLIISCSGTVGRVSVIRKDDPIGIISQALLILRPNTEKVLTDFLFYFFTSRIGYNSIISRSGGSVQANISKRAVIENIDIDVPPLSEQKSIVNILSALDKKIEVNNQINKTLDNMAQTIFKQWFVDFEFPNEDGEPYKSSGGEMVESELGMIPKGWVVVDIEHITLKANTGADAIRRAPIVDYVTETKCVRVGDLSQGRDISGWGYCETTEEDFVRFQLKQNDILVTRTGTIGLNILITEDLKAVFNNGLIRLRVKEEYNPIFIYQLINSKNYFDHINKITGETSTRPNMKINYLLRFRFALPTNHYMNEYSKFTKSILERITVVKYENEKLKQVRDSLLPKLMSGEIRVPLDEEGDVS